VFKKYNQDQKEKIIMRTITVTEGLTELKLLDARIDKAIVNANFCGAAKKSSDRIGAVSKETFKDRCKADFQSVTDLIKNHAELKSKIVLSNAITKITVNGVEMTRAEGIERKNSIEYEQNLLRKMKLDYSAATTLVDKENKKVDEKVDSLLTTLVGKDSAKKLTAEEQDAVVKPYRLQNEYEFVDPIDLYDKI
jgi:hypothetical protein